MISALRDLLLARSNRLSLLLLVGSAVCAVWLGFVHVSPAAAERLIVRGGYFYLLAVFALWLYYGWRVVGGAAGLQRLVPRWSVVALICGATAFAVWTDQFAHKVLFDEYVLQGTAWHMHRTKEVATPLRAFDFAGTWLVIDTFLDKRPYFFMLLVSLAHDLSGFRVENAFAVNVGVAAVTLGATFWLVRRLTGRMAPAVISVALLATLPLFGQNASAASMELLNLAMIAVIAVAATAYLQAPDDDRLSFLILGAVLLAQSRYESVLFVFPVALVVVLGWLRRGVLILPWVALIAPLLLMPYVWHDRFVNTKPVLWQLREGESARFGWRYLGGNLEGARNFFFSTHPAQPNSLWLVVLGGAALVVAGVQLARRVWGSRRKTPLPASGIAIGACATAVAANLGLLMFYYWSRLDEPIASRFALPSFFILALAAGWFVHWLDVRRWHGTRIAAGGLVAWLLIFAAPAYAHRFYTTHNLVMHELDWELEQVRQREGPLLLITGKAAMPFLLERVPALNIGIARVRLPQVAWHMRQGTFREVLVSQVLRPTSANGDPIVDPDEELPASLRLELLAEKRFGGRWIRISRVAGIDESGSPTTGSP